MPVLPAVPSTSVSPGLILPARSADSIIDRPMRSLIEPPGLAFSSLKNSSQTPASRRCALTIGVLPISSSTLLLMVMGFRYSGRRTRPNCACGAYRRMITHAVCPAAPAKMRGRRDGRGSVRRSAMPLPHVDELVLGPELFFLHVVQSGVVHRQHAQFGIAHLAVQFLVTLVQAAEFRIGLDQIFDVFLLVLEHQPTSCIFQENARAAGARRANAVCGKRGNAGNCTLAGARLTFRGEPCNVIGSASAIMIGDCRARSGLTTAAIRPYSFARAESTAFFG